MTITKVKKSKLWAMVCEFQSFTSSICNICLCRTNLISMSKRPFEYSDVNHVLEKVFRNNGHDDNQRTVAIYNKEIYTKQQGNEFVLSNKPKMTQSSGQLKNSDVTKLQKNRTSTKHCPKHCIPSQKKNNKKKKLLNFAHKQNLKGIEEDEQEISDLEKLMSMKSTQKQLPASFAKDGLDYILDVLDMEKPEEKNNISSDSGHNLLTEDLTDNQESLPVSASGETEVVAAEESNASGLKKIIASSNYIPPQKRSEKKHDELEKQFHLKRQLKGLLNRLSDANMHSVCGEVTSLLDHNSRALVTEALTDIILQQCCTPDPVPDKLITEYGMLISVVGNNNGISVISYFIETIAKRLDVLLKVDKYGHGKEYNNLLQLLCCLYQLQTTHSKLLLDQINIFTERFKEKDIELLVLIFNNVGFQIRKEDPVALKVTIEEISKKSQEVQCEDSSRMKYMVNVLTAIKNNNVRKLTGYDVDLISQRRKKVKALQKPDGDSFPNVSFSDLVRADELGRWWVVGSSWAGAPMLQNSKVIKSDSADDCATSQMMQIAKNLRMNTDVRRKIFYSVMSSEDYVEAYGKVLKLNLKGKQFREVCHVLVECCLQQKTFNPFYFHLLRKFCSNDRQFVLSLQCSFWDKFKLLNSMSDRQLRNTALLLAHLIVIETIPLSCFKAVEFTKMEKPMVAFLRKVLINVATLAESSDQLQKVFTKLACAKQKPVTQGLQLFIQYFMLNDSTFISEHSNVRDTLAVMDAALSKSRLM